MNVLVACEHSGQVRDAFRDAGHEAWSNDLEGIEPGGEWSNYHLYGDCRWFFDSAPGGKPWDLIIAHPPCTYLTCSAEWAYGDGPYHMKLKPETLVGRDRVWARYEALNFVREIMDAPCQRIALENPIGFISSAIRKPDQVIQPYQFGDDASKATCLWLKGLPILRPTSYIEPRIVNGKRRWANQTDSGQNNLSPSAFRTAFRSMTYPGIAAAMASQWGTLRHPAAPDCS